MIELSNADIAAEKALAKAIANVGIIPAIRDANLTRQSGNYGRRLIKLQEELGEHAEADLNVPSAGNGKGKTWDDVREEAADILIVAVDVALTPRPDTYETIEVVEKELVQSLKDYTFNQRQFSHALTSTYADYEALTLKVGAFVGAIGAKFAERGMSKAAAFELVGTAFMLALVPLPDQSDWTTAALEDQLCETIAEKLAKWRNNRDTGTAATDAE